MKHITLAALLALLACTPRHSYSKILPEATAAETVQDAATVKAAKGKAFAAKMKAARAAKKADPNYKPAAKKAKSKKAAAK